MRRSIGGIGLLFVTLATLGILAPRTPVAYAAKSTALKHMTGTVVAVDPQANTVTVERSAKMHHTRRVFNVRPDAAGVLAQLTPGQHVSVQYERDHGRLTADAITPRS
jgi:Cu/Ag efflux protein CusF